MHGHPEIGRPCPRHMRAELGLLGFEGFCVTGNSVVHTRRTGGLHSVIVGGLRIESGNAHPKNHVRVGRVATIGRLSDLRQLLGVGAIVHDAVVQVSASGICRSPANDRHALIRALEFRTRGDLCDVMRGRRSDHAGSGKMQ